MTTTLSLPNRREPLRRKLSRVSWLNIYSILVYVFLFLPISMIVLFSFNTTAGGLFPMQGLTLEWYLEVLRDRALMQAAQRSLLVATTVALLGGALGTLCSLGMARYKPRFMGALWLLILTPIVIPALMLGISLLTYYHALGIRLSLLTVVISHLVWAVPYVVFIVYARLKDFDWTVEEAARDLGATSWQTFTRITFPMIATSVLSAMLIIFAWSFDDFLVTFFTIGNQPTLPILIWGLLRKPVTPTLNAIGAMLFIFSVVLLLAARWIGKLDIEF